jgi:fructose-1,6-bisphosphatase
VARVEIKQPEELLELAAGRAEELGKQIDDLYVEAIERYIEVTKHASAGALRSRFFMARASPRVTVEIPDDLFDRAEKVAERLEKKRDVMYAEALAKHVARPRSVESAVNQGHDLPSGAWRPKGST